MDGESFENESATMKDERKTSYAYTTDSTKFDVGAIHEFLSQHAYWCLDIPRETVARALENSVSIGAFDGDRQVGLVRAVTDKATYAWVCDVYVLPEHRGRGIARTMLEMLLEHPELQGLRRWVLATKDAHDLYRSVGFIDLPNPERWMVIADPDVYSKGGSRA